MSINKNNSSPEKELFATNIELVPHHEELPIFQIRKEEVQVLLVDMLLRLRKRGRPRKDEVEKSYAA